MAERIESSIEEIREATTEDEIEMIKERLQYYLPESALLLGALIAKTSYKGIWDSAGTRLFFCTESSLTVAVPVASGKRAQSLLFFWDEDREDESHIVRLLSQIPGLDWSEPLFLHSCPLHLIEKVEELVKNGSLGNGVLRPTPKGRGFLYSLTSRPKVFCSLPEGFEIRTLSEEHAQHMYDHWEYKYTESAENYKNMVMAGPGYGVFKTTLNDMADSEDGNATEYGHLPVSWTHLSSINLFTNTFTLPEYRGRGLARSVTLALVEKVLDVTGVASACIPEGSEASLRMHEKLGFVQQQAIGYQYYARISGRTKTVQPKEKETYL